MNRFSIVALSLVLTSFFTGHLSAQAEDEALLGTWELTSMVMGGEPVHDIRTQNGQRIIFTPNSYYAIGAEDYPIGYVVSTDVEPHTIDCSFGQGSAVTVYGIYRIEGDTLTMCFLLPQSSEESYESERAPLAALLTAQQSQPMAERPTDFTSTAENGYQLQTFTRVPPVTIQPRD